MSKQQFSTIPNILNLNSQKGSDLTFRGLRKEAIVRGMPFIEVLKGDFPTIQHWLLKNVMKPVNEELLLEYDNYMDNLLREEGADYLIHKSFRFSYISGDEDDEKEVKKTPVVKEKKAPRQKDSSGLFKGTKKSYVSDLQLKGKTLAQVIEKVTRKFPDAKEKSIKIWYNKFKKERK